MNNFQQYANDEEIHNLFYFLGDENPKSKKEKIKSADIIFGLENYGLPIPAENIKLLKYDIERRTKDDQISIDEFKTLFTANVDTKVPTKDLTSHMFGMMREILKGKDADHANYQQIDKIDKKSLIKLLEVLNINDETPDFAEEEKESNKGSFFVRRSSIKKPSSPPNNNNKKSPVVRKNTLTSNTDSLAKIAEDMIKVIDVDGDEEISLKDFEFLINEYLIHFNKKN